MKVSSSYVKCAHEIGFDKFCAECEIVWLEEFIKLYEKKLASKKRRLKELKKT